MAKIFAERYRIAVQPVEVLLSEGDVRETERVGIQHRRLWVGELFLRKISNLTI